MDFAPPSSAPEPQVPVFPADQEAAPLTDDEEDGDADGMELYFKDEAMPPEAYYHDYLEMQLGGNPVAVKVEYDSDEYGMMPAPKKLKRPRKPRKPRKVLTPEEVEKIKQEHKEKKEQKK